MAKKTNKKKSTEVNFSPNKVTFGVSMLAAVSLLALAVMLFTNR